MSMATQRIEAGKLKQQLAGRGAEALQHIGIAAEFLTGKNGPCPKCGGKDRFRYDRAKEFCFCNQCHRTGNGDIIANAKWFTGQSFLDTLDTLADFAGMASPVAATKPTSKPRKTYPNVTQAAQAANHEGLPIETQHEYLSRAGDLLAIVLRLRDGKGEKTFRPIMQRPDGQWIAGTIEGPRPLYGLNTLDDAETVFIVEGEKTADALRSLGIVVVTWMSGAASWRKADWSPLANSPTVKQIALLPDNDKPGRDAMDGVASILRGANSTAEIKIVEVAGIIKQGDKADAADLVASYPGDIETPRAEILAAVDTAEPWKPEVKPALVAASSIDAPDITEISGQTDEANSRRLWLRNQGRFAWVHPWKIFVVYDGRRWTRDESMLMAAMGIETYHSLYDELKNIGQTASKESLRGIYSFIRKSGSAHGQADMLELVKSQPGIPVMPGEFNRDSMLFNVENGTIDLRTGKILAHCAADKITQIAPVVFDPAATCPHWRAFIELIFCGDAELIRYVKAAAGYSLTGSTEEHSLFFCYGKGSNGKSTFLNTLRDIHGDYGLAAAKDLLLTNGNEQHPTAMADLFGRRWVNCIEADEGKRLCESTVKMLTGGDAIRARGMRENFYEFQPTHKIWLSANHKPTVRGDDDGIWRRIKLIPFAHKFTDEQKDTKFPDKLRAEWSGILNWMLEGLADWRANGLVTPSAVAVASTEYRAEQDRLADWIEDRCIVASGVKSKAKALYDDYLSWAGTGAMSSTAFGTKLAERYEKKRGNGIWYSGIALAARSSPYDTGMEGLE